MFLKFGGHRLAAGFSILKKDIDKLRELLNEECELTEDDFVSKVYLDAEFPFYNFSVDLIESINRLEPFGQGFKKPTFATKEVKCSIKNVYGASKNVIQLSLSKDGNVSKAVAFTDYEILLERLKKNELLDIAYYPKINEFRGQKSVDITISEYR